MSSSSVLNPENLVGNMLSLEYVYFCVFKCVFFFLLKFGFGLFMAASEERNS